MTTKRTKTKEAQLNNLKQLIENDLPATFEGVSEGYHAYIDQLEDYDVLYANDINNLFKQIDQYLDKKEDLEGKIHSIVLVNDRFLLAHDLAGSVHASNELKEELKRYTDYMTPTERQLHEHRYAILDLFCTLYGVYGIVATIQALKKATGIKGFDFFINQMNLKKTTIKKSATLEEIKAVCRGSKTYKIEDYLMSLNAGLIELKERGIDLKVKPLDLAKVRPNTATIDEMIQQEKFAFAHPCGRSYLTIWETPQSYYKRFMQYHEVYLHQLLEEERYLHPEAYARRFGED